MDTQQASTTLLEPLRTAASALRRVPGAGAVTRATEGALDRIGAISPQGRRIAVYTGAGVLGLAGVVEWPIALTGAAVAWLTQPKPEDRPTTSARSGSTPSGTRGRTTATLTKNTTAQTKKATALAKKATASTKKSTGQGAKSSGPASGSTGQKTTSTGRGKSTARTGSAARRSSATG
ncbi:hypothetical protein ACIBW9_09485 [Streptomyces sp. NPDC049541]|uniref:hypothetical protein n=1 Tax=Streptomyces sp. NPDC049541 TaxID=3365594 RepID=UPI00379F8501